MKFDTIYDGEVDIPIDLISHIESPELDYSILYLKEQVSVSSKIKTGKIRIFSIPQNFPSELILK